MSTTGVSPAIEPLPSSALKLAALRKAKGLTLEDIAHSTQIALRFLEAIEAEEFAKLPGGVYNTSYIRQYAGAIGFNETTLLQQYHASKAQEPALVITLQKGRRPRTRFGEAMGSLLGHLSAKPRTHHHA